MNDQPRHHITGYGDIPRDVGHPRDPERGPLVANIVIASFLLLLCGGMLTYALLGPWW